MSINREKSETPEQVFIIKAKEPIIPWDKLTEDERANLLIRELGDLIFKRRDFLRTIRVLSELFTDVNKKDELQKILHGEPTRETVNFILSVNWIVPVINDVELVLNVGKDKKGVKVVSRDQWQKRVNDAGPTGDLTDAIKPYENVDSNHSYAIRSPVSRFGVREVDLDVYLEKGKLILRPIAENETIVIKGFVIDLKRAFQDNLIFDQSFKNLNLTQLFKNQFPLKGVDYLKYFEFKDDKSFNKQIPKIMDVFLLIEDLKRFSRNKHDFDKEELIHTNQLFQSIKEIKEEIPENLVQEREERIKLSIMKEDIIKSLYGKYYSENTLSDIPEQRELWTTQSYVGNIPFYLFSSQSNNARFENLINSAKLYDFVKKQDKKRLINEKDIERRMDIYEQAIHEQLSPFVLEKLQQEAKEKAVSIDTVLTTKQKKLVEQYIQQSINSRKEYEENKCPHFKLRAEFDNLVSLEEKFAVFQRMISTFGPKNPDPETQFLFCKNCNFNMGCQHEVIMMERYADKNKDEELTKILEDVFYSNKSTGSRAEFISCKFCGRKIADADISEQVEYNEDGVKITGEVIVNEDDDIIMLRNLASTVILHSSLSGAVNAWKLIDEIGASIIDRWVQVEKQELGTEDTELLKRLYAVAFIYAKLIKDMISSGFRFRFRKEYLPGDRNDLPKDNINPYVLAVLKIVRDRDRPFFDKLGLKEMKGKFTVAIKSAFNTLQKEAFRKDVATFNLARRIWGANWTPKAFIKNAQNEDTVTKIIDKLDVNSDDDKKIHKALLKAAEIRLSKIRKIFKTPIQNREVWKELDTSFDNNNLNYLFDSLVYNRIPKKYNRRFLKFVKLKTINPPKDDPSFYYTLNVYCEDGRKQKWDLTKLRGNSSSTTIKTSDLKRKLKAQKTAFDMNFDPAFSIKYFTINSTINVENINQFERELIDTQCGNITKKEATQKEKTKGPKDHQKLKEKVFERELVNEIVDVVQNACAGAPGQKIYWGTDILCGYDIELNGKPNKALISKIQNGLEKERKYESEVKSFPELSIDKPSIPVDFKTKKENIVFDKNGAESLINKIRKHVDLIKTEFKDKETLMSFLIDLGKFSNVFEEQTRNIEKDIFISKEDKDRKARSLKRDQEWSRLSELNNIIKRLQRDYRLIRTSETDIFLNSPSMMYLSKFIDDKKKNDFKDKIPDKYNVGNYYDIEYTNDISINRRIIMFLNIFINVMNSIVQTELSAQFAMEFLERAKDDVELADTSETDVQFVEDQLDLRKRKNMEIYMKMTPEEKIAKGFFEAGLEEQIELLNEEAQKAATIEDERAIDNYNEAQDTDKYAETLDDEQSYDDDDVFITDSFEVY